MRDLSSRAGKPEWRRMDGGYPEDLTSVRNKRWSILSRYCRLISRNLRFELPLLPIYAFDTPISEGKDEHDRG
jgi:hypothetical protein